MKRIEFNVTTGERKEIDLTPEEIADAQARTVAEQVGQYKQFRASAYPDYRDYLDGIVKGDAAQVQKYVDDCMAVKARFPK